MRVISHTLAYSIDELVRRKVQSIEHDTKMHIGDAIGREIVEAFGITRSDNEDSHTTEFKTKVVVMSLSEWREIERELSR